MPSKNKESSETGAAQAILGNLTSAQEPAGQAPVDDLEAGGQPGTGNPIQGTGTPDPTQQGRQSRQHQRLLTLETQMEKGLRSFIEALKAIVTEKLYRVLGFKTLDEYMEVRWAKTRQWAYQQLRWLEAVESLEGREVKNPLQNLSVDAASVFRHWRYRPEVFYLAYQKVVGRGEEPTKRRLEEEAAVQSNFLLEADRIPDLTWEEYQAYQRLEDLPWEYNLKGGPAEELLASCRAKKGKPSLQDLAEVARGDDLVRLVEQLVPLAAEVAKVKGLKAKKAELERQKREMGKGLVEQIRQLDEEISGLEPPEDEAGTDGGDDAGDPGGDTTAAPQGETDDRHEEIVLELEDDPKAFLADVLARVELFAGRAESLTELKGELLDTLGRIGTALDRIRTAFPDPPGRPGQDRPG